MRNRILDVPSLRRLRLLAVLEGTTLACLVFLAVPMKHMLGIPVAVRVIGPIHGVAFVAYVWTVTATVSGGGWKLREVARLVIGALIPFAGFFNERWLRNLEVSTNAQDVRSWPTSG